MPQPLTCKQPPISHPKVTFPDIQAVIKDVRGLIPADDAARNALSAQAGVFRFLKESLDSLVSEFDERESSKEFELAVLLAKLIAEVAKCEPARSSFADVDGIPSLIKLHQISVKHLQTSPAEHYMDALTVQTMRALANLCFDQDMNRDLISEIPDAAASIVAPLASENTQVLHTTAGAIVNISMDNEPLQMAMIEARVISLLHNILTKVTDEKSLDEHIEIASASAIRALSNVIEPDEGMAQFLEQDGLKIVLHLVKRMHAIALRPNVTEQEFTRGMEYLDGLSILIETLGENENAQREIVKQDLLDILLDIVDQRPTFQPQMDPEADPEDGESNVYDQIRKSASRIVTSATMNDDNMVILADHVRAVERFKLWMASGVGPISDGTHKEEDDIRVSGSLCIGNIARSDDTCLKLVRDHGVVPALLSLVKFESDRLRGIGMGKDDTKGTIKVLHAVIGALKNISIAPSVRKTLGSLGTIERIVTLFEFETLQPIHYSCVGIIKNLCSGDNDANVYRTMTGMDPGSNTSLAEMAVAGSSKGSPLSRLISLIWKAVGDNDTGIRNEGGRVVVNIIRAIHRTQAVDFVPILYELNCITPLVQIVTGALLVKGAQMSSSGDVIEENHVHFNAMPSESQVFPLIQNEGIVSLTLLCLMAPKSIGMIARFHSSLVPTLLGILKNNVAAFNPPPAEVPATGQTGDSQHSLASSNTSINRGASPRASLVSEKPNYSVQTKVNATLLLSSLVSDPTFRSRIQDELANVVRVLLDVSHNSGLTPASTLAVPTAETAATPTSTWSSAGMTRLVRQEPLARTNTRSAKNLTEGNVSRRELQSMFKLGTEEATDPHLSLVEGLTRLKKLVE